EFQTQQTVWQVDLSTGLLFQDPNTTTGWSEPSFSSTSLGSGWYQLTFSACINTSTAGGLSFNLLILNSAPTANYTGDGSSGFLIYPKQMNWKFTPAPLVQSTTEQKQKNQAVNLTTPNSLSLTPHLNKVLSISIPETLNITKAVAHAISISSANVLNL